MTSGKTDCESIRREPERDRKDGHNEGGIERAERDDGRKKENSRNREGITVIVRNGK